MRTQTPRHPPKRKKSKKRKAYGTFNDNQKDSIVLMFLSGFLPEEIAPEFDSDAGSIKTVLEERGYRSERYRVNENVVAQWQRAYEKKNMTLAQIAAEYDSSPSTVRFHLARRGVKIKHPAFYRATGKRKRSKKVH